MKLMRHIQIRENSTREYVHDRIVKIIHVAGKLNTFDIFTKDDKDATHFIQIFNTIV